MAPQGEADHGGETVLDPGESSRIALHMKSMSIRYAVITSVTRDDLLDGGAGYFGRVVADIRAVLPDVGNELLVPDFQGSSAAVASEAALPIEVFGHNLETVASLHPLVRRGADYALSLEVLRTAHEHSKAWIKSGIPVVQAGPYVGSSYLAESPYRK